jgi:hypothetical protein
MRVWGNNIKVNIRPVLFLNLILQCNTGQSGGFEIFNKVILNLKIKIFKYFEYEALWDKFISMIVCDRVVEIVVTLQKVTCLKGENAYLNTK